MELPDKVYFRIGEVADALSVKPHVVRFWQKEFTSIRPERSRSGRFLYTRKMVEHIDLIRQLLYEEGYTIQGARRALRDRNRGLARTKTKATPSPNQPKPANKGSDVKNLESRLAESETVRARLSAQVEQLETRLERLRLTVNSEANAMLASLENSLGDNGAQ